MSLPSFDDGGNVPSEEHSEARVYNTTISDPGSWPPKLTDSLCVSVVKQGPAKPDPMYENSKDAFNLRFTVANMKLRMKNGEEVNHQWLVYSSIKNAVFCFCCKLFTSLDVALTKFGYNDWRNLYHTLKDNETSKHHLEAHKKWIELSDRLNSNTTVDERNQRSLNAETCHWQAVLERLVAIVQFLGQQCLAFRGSSDILHEENNGNYLKLVELFCKI
jgi:hypothetical protein